MKKLFIASALLCSAFSSVAAQAGGIALGTTRIIYPQGAKEATVSVKNSSDKSQFLVQSWVENSAGSKIKDFVVTPPVYVSGPKNENKLRVMYAGTPLPQDKESLFYFNTKAIPAVDKKSTEGKNILVIAAITRIKMFIRPAGLSPAPEKAPEQLTFRRAGSAVKITNPTPYYITIASMTIGGREVKKGDLMVPPKGEVTRDIPQGVSGTLMVSTINDYGAHTHPLQYSFN